MSFCLVLVAVLLAAPGGGPAAGAPTTTDPDRLASQARTLKEFRDCRGALRAAAALLQRYPQSEAARSIDRLIDSCLADLTWKELDALADHSPVPRIAAKAMLLAANRRTWADECPAAIAIYDRLASRHPDTTEAWRGSIRKAVNCLDPMGRHQEALSILERVVEKAGHSPEAAFALYELGILHREHEEREEARAPLERLIRDYPADFEYPSSPGWKIVESARLDLEWLDRYALSPMLDRIVSRVERIGGLDQPDFRTWRYWMSLSVVSLVSFATQIAALLLVLSLLGMARLAGLSPAAPGARILGRSWSVPRACWILVVFCAMALLFELFGNLVRTFDVPGGLQTFFWVHGERVATLVTSGVILVACLWKESIRRIFAIGRRSLIWVGAGLALMVVGGSLAAALRFLILRLSGRAAEPALYRDLSYGDLSTVRAAIVTVGTTVLAAAAEECVFRGVLYEAFSGLSRRWVAAVLCSILFGAVHVVPFGYFTTLTLSGLVLTFVRDRSGGLFAPLVLHSLGNLLVDLARAHPS